MALVPQHITTLYSYPDCVQNPEKKTQKTNTSVSSCGCLRQAGSSPSILPDNLVISTSPIFDTKAKRYSSIGCEEPDPAQTDGKFLLVSPGAWKPSGTALDSFLLSLKFTGNITDVQIVAFENLGFISSNDHFSEILITLKSWIPMFPVVIKALYIDFLVRHYLICNNELPSAIQIPINYSLWKMDSTKHLSVTMI